MRSRNQLTLALIFVLAACGDDPEPGAPSCQVDAQLVAQRRACVDESHCPCGTSCLLGVCAAACTTNDDCGGGVCDSFGQCRSPNAVDVSRRAEAPGTVVLSDDNLEFLAAGESRRLRLSSMGGDLGAVRIVAPSGYSVRCGPSAEAAAECTIAGLAFGDRVDLNVVLDVAPSEVATDALRIFHGNDRYSVGLVAIVLEEKPLSSGRYVGFARTTHHGFTPDAPISVDGAAQLPVTAELFIEDGIIRVVDPQGALHPDGQLIGDLDASGITWPDFAVLNGAAALGAELDVVVNARTDTFNVSGASPSLAFDIVATYRGVSETGADPFVQWSVVLERVGDLDAGRTAPERPAAAPAPVADRAAVPTGWSMAMAASFDVGPGTATVDDGLGALRVGTIGQFDVCQDGHTNRLVAAAAKRVFDGSVSASGMNWRVAFESAESPILRALGEAYGRDQVTPADGDYTVTINPTTDLIPCQIAPPRMADGTELGSIDACDEIAARFACSPERLGDETVELRIEGATGGTTLNAVVERICRPTTTWTAAGCAEMALCYELPATGPTNDRTSMTSSILAPTTDASGDLACAFGSRSAGLNEARSTGALFDVLAACVTELDRARTGPAPMPTVFHADALQEVLDENAGCLDAARFFFALEQASIPVYRVDPSAWQKQEHEAVLLSHQLVRQWLSLHALVARESTELEKIRSLVSLESGLLPERAVEVSLDGLSLLLHPRFVAVLVSAPASILAAPDYRVARFPSETFAAADAEVGLPAVIIETLSANAELLDRLIVRAARRGEPEALQTHARFLRMEAPIRALAATLAERAETWTTETGAPKPAWIERYRSSLAAYQGRYTTLLADARAFLDGKNPLGVEDADLPLYFFGDESTPSSQFTAISDFLLGQPGSPVAWVPSAIASADSALDSARTAGVNLQGRAFERTRSQTELDNRLDDIRRTFGGEVISYCGLPPGLTALDVLENWDGFNANDCFILRDESQCVVDTAKYESLMSIEDVRYQFCVVNELRERTAGATGMVLSAWDDLAVQLEDCDELRYGPCPDGADGPCVTCKGIEELPPFAALNPSVAVAFDALCELEALPGCESVPVPPSLFRGVRGAGDVPPALLEEARQVCQARFPSAVTELPGPSDLEEPRDNSCFNGAIGGMALNLDAVAKDIEIARSEMADLQDAYDVAMTSCIIQQKGNDTLEATQSAHNRTMSSLRKQKAAADNAAAIAGAAKDCASTASGVTNPFAAGAAGASCAAGAVEAGAEVVSNNLEREMEDAQDSHDALMMSLENQIQEEICFNDAELHLVGVRTASLRIERAVQDLNSALYEFDQSRSSAQLAYDSGNAALDIARDRLTQPAAHDFWFDEEVDTFEARMRIARRLTFLAVRAVEYEFQQSLDLRADTLAADLPAELESVVVSLQGIAATRAIRGSRPADLKVVLSMKKNLLQLADLSTQPEGWHQLDETTRFRRLLTSPRYAAYDDEGRYVGQQIPFDLAPLGALDLGDAGGIDVLAANDCAERVWSVNASIMGDDLYRGDAPTFTRVDLLKANTFYSQWCADPGDGSFQVGSVRPARNLFQDPRSPATVGENLAASDAKGLFTRARIEAYFNVSRADFESDDYASGATSELAARGLYGRHALFIPAQVLSEGEGDDGLVLGAVNDILLRLDYVSVAR